MARARRKPLSRGYAEVRFKQLILVASPAFLGIVRKLLDPKLAAIVHLKIDKDYAHFDQGQLCEQIRLHEKSHQ